MSRPSETIWARSLTCRPRLQLPKWAVKAASKTVNTTHNTIPSVTAYTSVFTVPACPRPLSRR